MGETAKIVAEQLTPEDFEFIESETGVTKEKFLAMSDDEVIDFSDPFESIEISEVVHGKEKGKRCKIASKIVTLIGNLYEDDEEE